MNDKYEVEVKIPVHDIEGLRHHLKDSNYPPDRIEHQVDLYYNHPCRDFSQTDEALRVRRCIREYLDAPSAPVTEEIELTYKGPKIDPLSKTRIEFNLSIDDIDSISAVLDHLGFVRVGTVQKTRTYYHLDSIELCIDEVENLGSFVELETVVLDETQIPSARDNLLAIASRFGLPTGTSIRKSYLEMLLEKQ